MQFILKVYIFLLFLVDMRVLIIHKDMNCILDKQLSEKFPEHEFFKKWKNIFVKDDLDGVDLILTVGGDGTFLSASHFIDDQLILGVNSDVNNSEGALTQVSLDKLERKLSHFFSGQYKIREYQRERVVIHKPVKKIITEHALNETYLGNQNPHHPSNYLINYNGKIEDQRSSGVLVTTGTGSTAWYKAMGGKKFKRTKSVLKFKIRELFTGRIYNQKIRNGVLNKNEKLVITSKMNHGILAIDSIRTYVIEKGDIIEISLGLPLKAVQ